MDTAVMDAPSAVDTSADMDLGETLGAAYDSAIENQETPAAPVAPAAPQETPAAPVTDAPAETQAVTNPDSPYQLAPDGNSYLVPKDQLPILNSFKQYAEKTQEWFPSIQDAEVAYKQSSDFGALMQDFTSGGPAETGNVLKFLSGEFASDPQIRQQSQQAFARLAEQMPSVLKNINPEAHSKLAATFFQAEVEGAYARAAQTGDPKDLLAAQRLDWGKTGRYKTELPKIDPAKAAADQLAQQQAQFEQRQTQALTRDWNSFNKTEVDGPKWQQFGAELDRVLAPVKGKFTPAIYEAVKENISKQVNDKLQNDFEWARTHGNQRKAIESGYRDAWKTQQPADRLKPSIQAYNNDFMTRVRRYLPAVAAGLINEATNTAVQPKPQAAPPNQPAARAANGQFQQTQKPEAGKRYSFSEDPEWDAAFRVA